jgi:hypothetical protein
MFEITVSLGGVRYQYGFEATPARITAEWLLVYQSHKPQVWFDRRLDPASSAEEFKFGAGFAGQKRVWQEATRPNALFLSTAVQLNSEALSPLYAWFAERLHIVLDGGQFLDEYSTEKLQNPLWERRITHFLAAADIGISSIRTHKLDGVQHHFRLGGPTGQAESRVEKREILRPKFLHRVGDHSLELDLEDESQGTQALYALAGPLFEILESGSTLVIDELDRSLHPLLVRQLIQQFHDPDVNASGAQLIFTTHDTSQLDTGLLRRDQIWFTEKQADQASELIPLMDYSPRKGEALERGYLSGRYGAIPILPGRLFEKAALAQG